MEVIEQFYLKRHNSEYDEMRKLVNNISSRRNVEFANYDKYDKPILDIINRVEMTKKLCPRVEIDLAPFLSDLFDRSATTNCKLGPDRFVMMASRDPVYMVDTMRTQANIRRDEATQALADANARMESIIKQKVNESLDKDVPREKKVTTIERDCGDRYKEQYNEAFSQISDLEADLKQAKQDLKDTERKQYPFVSRV
uniref:Uncharacterized protein n=1 Tax=Cannabis sativa TaxID=3483 RepID=A0A803NN27_CANSA